MIGPVVSVNWWQQHRDEVVLADVRWYLDGRSGRDAYDAGHLPGAVFVDLDRWLAAGASPEAGRHPLPDPAVFAAGMAGLGIADDSTVVAYDDAGGTVAARLVWMLRVTGHAAALLDGGLPAYQAALEKAALEKTLLEKTLLEKTRNGRPPGSRRVPGPRTASPVSVTPPIRAWSSSTPATGRATAVTASRSTRAPGTFRAPATCPAARTSPPMAPSFPSPACASDWPARVSRTPRRS